MSPRARATLALIEPTRTLIANYKKPNGIDFVDSLPQLFNGKYVSRVNTSGEQLQRRQRKPQY